MFQTMMILYKILIHLLNLSYKIEEIVFLQTFSTFFLSKNVHNLKSSTVEKGVKNSLSFGLLK